jgi:2,5-diamino-6-(ribosylamino)-4(3H)-pyrimidinone 5'-phosphate reductase
VVRVDSGGILNGVLLKEGLVDEVSILIHPYLIGGTSPRSIYNAADLVAAAGIVNLKLIHLEQLANDLIWIRYEIKK